MVAIKIFGGGREVGRVAVMVDLGVRLLLDAGIAPTGEGEESLPLVEDWGSVDSIVLTHPHLDHSGAIPYAVEKGGFMGRIVSTPPTIALCRILWTDAVKVMRRRSGKTLYSMKGVNDALKAAEPRGYREEVKVSDDVTVMLFPASHTLGSSIATVTSSSGFKLVFTGDLGTASSTLEYWRVEDEMKYPDVLVIEATYAGRRRPSRKIVERAFVEKVREALERGGKVLIPSSSVGKFQEVLKILRDNEGKLPDGTTVYLEGLGVKATRVYEAYPNFLSRSVHRAWLMSGVNPFKWRSSKTFNTLREREKVLKSKSPTVILAPSGMLEGGMSVWWLRRLAEDPKNLICLVGYQDPDSTGYRLEKGEREVEVVDFISGEKLTVKVEAEVSKFEISSHASHEELLTFISNVKPRVLIVIHGDQESTDALKEYGSQMVSQAFTPENGDAVIVEEGYTPPGEVEEIVEIPSSVGDVQLVFRRGERVIARIKGRERALRAEDLARLIESLRARSGSRRGRRT